MVGALASYEHNSDICTHALLVLLHLSGWGVCLLPCDFGPTLAVIVAPRNSTPKQCQAPLCVFVVCLCLRVCAIARKACLPPPADAVIRGTITIHIARCVQRCMMWSSALLPCAKRQLGQYAAMKRRRPLDCGCYATCLLRPVRAPGLSCCHPNPFDHFRHVAP